MYDLDTDDKTLGSRLANLIVSFFLKKNESDKSDKEILPYTDVYCKKGFSGLRENKRKARNYYDSL
jgi:hypothetical protein